MWNGAMGVLQGRGFDGFERGFGAWGLGLRGGKSGRG